jgi:hypothetical protein
VSADPARRTILVRYLVTQTDYQSLERALEAAGLPPADSRCARFKAIGGKEGKGSRRIFVRLQGATAGA